MINDMNLPLGQEKELEADDPMTLVMTQVPGTDPVFMATCLIEEYARMGLSEEEILLLFSQPTYQTHALYRERGDAWVRNLIRDVLARTGQYRVRVKVSPKSDT